MTDFPNPNGDVPLGYGLWLRTQDMLTFGELYLNDGVHNGQRILDKDWIEKSWQRHSNQQNSQTLRTSVSWYNPINNGQGFNLEVIDQGRVIGYWYTYGDNGKRWFVLNGTSNKHQADLSIIQTQGGQFLQSDPVTESEWGTAQLSIEDCDHMTMEINSDEVVTSIPLTRLTGACDGAIAITEQTLVKNTSGSKKWSPNPQ